MDLTALESMTEPELREYVDFLLWHYRVADAFWFIYVGERFGQASAEDINGQVWHKAGGMGAKELLKRFGVEERGLAGFVKALRLYPWTLIIGYEIEERDGEVILSVPSCPPQEARLKRGLGEYDCKAMHCGEFCSFAQQVDERIRVECIFAPPDRHPADLFCKWRFTLEATR